VGGWVGLSWVGDIKKSAQLLYARKLGQSIKEAATVASTAAHAPKTGRGMGGWVWHPRSFSTAFPFSESLLLVIQL